ncbi:Ig-like domain-containing protein, partial [Vibrio azureus]|uniref:Ig-like domain-containing protein n=1 Tax=Vibrio azureus TaxID=512649 RepID=UPI001D129DF5
YSLFKEGEEKMGSVIDKNQPDNDPYPIQVTNLDPGQYIFEIDGEDKRGNGSKSEFEFNVHNSGPEISNVSLKYKNENENENENALNQINGAYNVFDNKDIVITFKAKDVSGLQKRINVTVTKDSSGDSVDFEADLSSGDSGDSGYKDYTFEITKDKIQSNGLYKIDIDVLNKVKFNEGDQDAKNKLTTKLTLDLNVQRSFIDLKVAKPNNFTDYISNKELTVEFDVSNDTGLKIQKLKCIVQNDWKEGDDINESSPSVTVISPTSPKCSVKLDNQNMDNPVLITQTEANNGKVKQKEFSFKMVDTVPPEVDLNMFTLSEDNVGFNEDNSRMLSFELPFVDNLSGVNISDKDNDSPYLVKSSSSTNLIKPYDDCEERTVDGEAKTFCPYRAKFDDIINITDSEHTIKVKNLSDNANNKASDKDITLEWTKDTISKLEITTPASSPAWIQDKGELKISFYVEIEKGSKLHKLSVSLEENTYNSLDNSGMFSPSTCQNKEPEDKIISCYEFTVSSVNSAEYTYDQVNVNVKAENVWGQPKEESRTLRFDNKPPVIGDEVLSIENVPNDSSKVRLKFDIKDEESGLQQVKYGVRNIGNDIIIDKTKDFDFIDINISDLDNIDSLTVDITATDNVGLFNPVKTIDIPMSLPQLLVTFDENLTSLRGKTLVFTNQNQPFTITSTEGSYIKAKSYAIDMISTSGDTLNFSGNITSSTPNTGKTNGTMYFAIDDQTEYDYTLTVTDSIGRTIKDFKLFNDNSSVYGAREIKSIVDYQKPSVLINGIKQGTSATDDGKYQLDVTAQATDKNLASVTSTVFNDLGLQVSKKSIEEPNPDDSYTFSHSLEPGNYKIKVTATDLVGKTGESRETDVEVVASKVPTLEIKIPTNENEPLAGGTEIPLTFTFSEEVKEFDISDVKLDENNGGELKPLSWSTTDYVTWTVIYVTPRDENKKVTISVEDDSYKSTNNINGKGYSIQLDVDGELPKLEQVTFDPLHQKIGEDVQVELKFDKDLQAATATLGANNITLIADDENKKVWTGSVKVPDVPDLGVGLVVSQYKDLVGNVGEDNTSYTLPITPTLTINDVGKVDESKAENYQFTGTAKRLDDQILSV